MSCGFPPELTTERRGERQGRAPLWPRASTAYDPLTSGDGSPHRPRQSSARPLPSAPVGHLADHGDPIMTFLLRRTLVLAGVAILLAVAVLGAARPSSSATPAPAGPAVVVAD